MDVGAVSQGMKAWSVLGLGALLLSSAACNVSLGNGDVGTGEDASPGDETVDETAVAGANQNDRSLGRDGEDLETGAMVASPDGRFLVLQRNTVTLVYDVAARTYRELPAQLDRVAFAKRSDTIFAHFANGSLVAIDLSSLASRWRVEAASTTSLLRVSDDDAAVLIGEPSALRVIDAATGAVRNTAAASGALYAAFVPGQARALVVAPTVWHDAGPHTPVLDVDLDGGAARPVIDVPNCAAPIVVTPNAARAFLSPTYCSPGAQAVPGEVWTNPDPVSVIDLGAARATFQKNLPGFGPVVMSKDGTRLVAYLDVKRMDAKMFDDASQVPWKEGQRYHLMTIDPSTLKFQLSPIGNAIPRFASRTMDAGCSSMRRRSFLRASRSRRAHPSASAPMA